MSEEKAKLIKDLNSAGIDINFIIQESFLGYKYRKKVNKLYEEKAETPTKLIKMYYSLAPGKVEFDKMKKAFITKYINNESELEGTHNSIEIKGLKAMYEYIHSDDVNYLFDVYTLKDLNAKLFSFTEYPEYAGDFRRFDVYLPGTGTELSEWSMIRPELKKIDIEIQKLFLNNNQDNKSMLIKVTDKRLLEKTGGIIQGMSGAPIIQNGKFVGAVTHVLVNDPTMGYGVFADIMLKQMKEVDY